MNTAFEITRDIARSAFETPLAFVGGTENAIKLLFRGDFGDAAKAFGGGVLNTMSRPIGAAVDIITRSLQAGASIFSPPSKPLDDTSKAFLRQLYGDSIDLDEVRIKRGDVSLKANLAAHVVGNTIYLPEHTGCPPVPVFQSNGDFTQEGLELLVHEAGHIWQNQNTGGDYIHKALFAGLSAVVLTDNRNNAYPWRPAVQTDKPVAELNPEQFAEMMEDVAEAVHKAGGRPITARDFDDAIPTATSRALSNVEFAYVLAVLERTNPGTANELARGHGLTAEVNKLLATWNDVH